MKCKCSIKKTNFCNLTNVLFLDKILSRYLYQFLSISQWFIFLFIIFSRLFITSFTSLLLKIYRDSSVYIRKKKNIKSRPNFQIQNIRFYDKMQIPPFFSMVDKRSDIHFSLFFLLFSVFMSGKKEMI